LVIAPALFVSHDAPTVALEEDGWSAALRRVGAAEPRPRAVAVISAHWESGASIAVGAAPRPRTIHDFGGFPRALYDIQYPASGEPALARTIADRLVAAGFPAGLDPGRGLDHGAWVPLRFLYPNAGVPVVPVSLPELPDVERLYRLGEALAPLRDEGVLLLGSGSLIHNLARIDMRDKARPPDAWARAFDAWMAERIAARDLPALARWREDAPHAAEAAPTSEHLDPLFGILGAARPGDAITPLFEGFHHGNLGMRSIHIGARASNA
jgi:4,5-DOPA dioxygenase extradiol